MFKATDNPPHIPDDPHDPDEQSQDSIQANPDDPVERLDLTQPIVLETFHDFVRVLFNWHGEKIKRMQQMRDIDAGITLEFNGIDHPMDGEFGKGFRIGIQIGLMELGKLPFMAEINKPKGDDEPVH